MHTYDVTLQHGPHTYTQLGSHAIANGAMALHAHKALTFNMNTHQANPQDKLNKIMPKLNLLTQTVVKQKMYKHTYFS